MVNGHLIWSASDVQQGDPLGPLLFALDVHDIVSSMKCNFEVWYLDDASIAGDPRSVCDNMEMFNYALCHWSFSESIKINQSRTG